MSFHATGAAFSARSDRLSKFRNHLMSSVCAALIIAAAGPGAHAQEVPGRYFNADGSRTDDLEKAAATWRADKEFQGNWGIGALKAEYAYARGLYGQSIKIGVVDSGIYLPHSEFTTSRFHPVAVEGSYSADNNWTDKKKRTFKRGEAFNVPGVYIPGINDAHGTEVSGTIGAAKDGVQFHGVSFEADIYSANTNGTDSIQQGSNNLDYNYFKAIYDALGKQGTRIINNSWGQISSIPSESLVSTPNELANAYKNFEQLRTSGHKTWLDAIAESVEKHDVLQTNWAGNADVGSPTSPSLEPNLAYFRPELEGHWLAVSGYARDTGQVYNKCGVAKYWCIMAPTDVLSTGINGGYSPNFNGTSAATPHASASLALIMQRFPYMTNAESLSVMLTTAQNMEDDPNRSQHTLGSLYRSVSPLKPGLTNLPNIFGWGLIDLKKAMNGPAQFLGRFDANLGAGVKDTWSNDISQVALDQRKREEAEEVAAWTTRKKVQGWESGFGEKQRSELAKTIEPQFSSDKIAAAEALLTALFKAVAAATEVNWKITLAKNITITVNPLASALLADFKKAYPKSVTTYGSDPTADYADYKTSRKQDPLTVLKQTMLAEQIAALETEYQFTESRTAYLSDKLADPKSYDAGLTKSGPGLLWLTGKNTYRGDTLINGGELGIGLGGSVVSTSIINDTGLLTVDGTTAAVTANAGGQLKVNATGVTGDLALNGGFASVDGRSGAAAVNTGGVLSGIGTVERLAVHEGGMVAPGNSIGTLHVATDATFDKDTGLLIQVAADGRSDRLEIAGKATLLGGVVTVTTEEGKAPLSPAETLALLDKTYMILATAGGVSGTFDKALPHYYFIGAALAYAANDVSVSLARNNVAFADVGETKNQKAAASGVESLGRGNLLYDTVAVSTVTQDLPAGFSALSGEAHASLRGTLLQDAGLVSGAASERVRAAFDGVAAKAAPVATPLAYGPDDKAKRSAGEAFDAATPAPAVSTTALWGQAYGDWSHGASDGNAAAYNRSTGGIVTGIDALIAGTWRLGVLAGYGSTALHGAGSSVSADSYQLGVYGGTTIDALTLSLGTVLAHHEIDTRRTVAFGTLEETDTAGYSANTVQLFGEAAYRIETPYAALEPFAAAAYTHLKTDGFTETGGIAALSAPSSSTDLTTTTLGLRASRAFTLGNATTLTARGMAGWRHAYGDVTPQAQFAFASGGESFDVSGRPIAADAALVEAGLAIGLGKATTIGLTYTGQFSAGVNDNAVKADLTVRF